MKFIVITKDNKRWLFDNLNNNLLPLDGISKQYKYLKENFKKQKILDVKETCDQIKQKSREIKRLRIFIGSNCNYKCSFCIQKYQKLHSPMPKDDEINTLISKFDNGVLKLIDDVAIEFWGGEPLVYFKALKKLIPAIRSRYPNAVLSMVSNGTLITEKMIEFLIEQRVNLTFSHDGQAYFLRGEDPLQNEKLRALWQLTFKRYKEAGLHFGINCVISQHNTDLYALQSYLQERIHPEIQFNFEGMVIAHVENAVNVCVFPKKSIEQLKQAIQRAVLIDKESNLHKVMFRRVYKIVEAIMQNKPSYKKPARCDIINSNSMAINIRGDVLKCHNISLDNWVIGNIDDLSKTDLSHYKTWSDRDVCKQCHLVYTCAGDCPINNGIEFKTSCYTQKIYHQIFFEIALNLITGSEIKSITRIN